MYLNEYTGRGVRVAVVDSGVNVGHPHVGGVEEGVAVNRDGSLHRDFADRLGHGTAVAAAIHEKAPDAAIIAVKVFWHRLATDVSSLVRGVDEASARGADVINLSLGTANAAHAPLLEAAVGRAVGRGSVIVAAIEDGGVSWLPGSLDRVIAVRLDWDCPRDTYRLGAADGRQVVAASGFPRDIPNVPREKNLKGISFAVANTTGFVARALESLETTFCNGPAEILAALEQGLRDRDDRRISL
jgi:subtilisin family serine protease